MSTPRTLHLGVDLTHGGAHAGGWRAQGPVAPRPFDAARLAGLVATAQHGLLDFLLFDDSVALRPQRGAALQGRLDAALVSARLAPRSAGIGLVATVDTTHTEPFHVSKAIATIDHVSGGRAAWQLGWSTDAASAAAFGRRPAPDEVDALREAEEAVEVVERLWDSWEDDAEIRDEATHRFVDRDKLHYVDFEGVHFAVKGPSITPRSPQGRPPVVVRADSPLSLDLAGRRADVVRVLVDLVTVVGQDRRSAQERLDLLEELGGEQGGLPEGVLTHVGTAVDLADLLEDWFDAGAADGFTLRPASLDTDLRAIVGGTVPVLQADGVFRQEYPGTTLRDTLGLPRPASRYAAAQ
jgi:alkanesulfonate monooxygenase SsuD/methylene tetrahydromethanopterin reductase-like flavin-dependent oxidoreductase (luciferase family)